MTIPTGSFESGKILFNSFKLFPGITILYSASAAVSISAVLCARRWLSVAIQFNLLPLMLQFTPVKIGRVSAVETANTVCRIRFFKISAGIRITLSSVICGKCGYSSASSPFKLKLDLPERMMVWNWLATSISTISIGSFLTSSPKIFACSTMPPVCWMTAISSPSSSFGTNDSIEISESLPVNVIPSSEAVILMPVKIGIVVLDVMAFDTSWTLSIRRFRKIENFMVIPPSCDAYTYT